MSVELMKKLYKMQQNREGTDCCFAFEDVTKDSSEKTEARLIYAHKQILSVASSVFTTMLAEKWVKDENIVMKDVSFRAFEILIKTIYTGTFELEGGPMIRGVYCLAHSYQVHDVIELISAYMIKISKYCPRLIVIFLEIAYIYDNADLMEACMNQVKLNAQKVLEADTFTSASTEIVNLICSLDPLNIGSDIVLMRALQKYIQVHPESRPELENAIHEIRFLTMEDSEIRGCQFLTAEIKQLLVILKNNTNLPTSILTGFSEIRKNRSKYKLLSTLSSNAVLKLYELFNDRHCFFCKENHSCFTCSKVLAVYKPYTYLSSIYRANFSHTCLERYTNEDITSILRTFNQLALDQKYDKTFDLDDDDCINPASFSYLPVQKFGKSPEKQNIQAFPGGVKHFVEGNVNVELIEKLFKMQQNGVDTDCCFSFEDSSEETGMRLICAHKLILSAASSVFTTMLSEKWVKDEIIVIKDVSYGAFGALIKAIYTGRFKLEKEKELLEVYSVAHLYQVDDVKDLTSIYMNIMCKYVPRLIVPFLNLACMYDNLSLKKECLNQVKSNAKEVLEAETFTSASANVVTLIFSLDPLNIESDIVLMKALEKYLAVHPEVRPELDEAVNNIRFLTIEDGKLMECQFLDTEIKERLVIFKNNSDLPMVGMPNFSENRNHRSDYNLLSTLSSKVVLKLYELFNDRHCFLCKEHHSCFSCSIVLAMYEPYKLLSKIYKDNFSHTCLERYSNDHIKAILRTFDQLALDEMPNQPFDEFLDLI